ncbi:YobI family P-loop NTPase [Flavobacterium johnsoniae]|uniref:YobI-like P-loop NTPase domain-containing protein n=1 Tax=Flavobacterium johnsoniae TaxID=986 RepID=A0A1M5IW63_FLAJO|nr:hypothetical protein [Flavobacterium johnsoniae]SHG32557.1 hypothetical protein SAMN05444388_102278 [Flavobacterium johnsoniae]
MTDQNENQDVEENENSSEVTNDSQKKDIELEILSPRDKKDDPRIKKYLRHLKSAIDNKEIKNLALSGVYGSGKSTIIKSFKSQYTNFEVLNISLASFNESNNYTEFKDQIQLNILQQIIYSQKAEKLPESRISRISELNVWDYKNWIKVGAFLLLIISTYLLLSFYSYQLNPNNWKLADNFNFSCFFLIILSFISMSVIGQIFIELLKNIRINKISLKDAEFGNKAENKDLLNKHIDEILYFFEKISIDIVVIEDLDRFNTTEIYRTLREINFILNSYLYNIKPNDPRKITFLYAIKDDIFLNELDRTKFFDLIIPAIPYVNYSNSKNVLNEKLDKIFVEENAFNKPTKEFIHTISSFINDNRTLINIINEFIVYKEQQKLENEELNPEKLLALIIYKNLRPKDFSRLHLSKSNIDLMFLNKGKLIEKSILNLDKKIDLVVEKIEKINKINVQNIRDLNTIYIYNIKEILQDANAKGLMFNSERTPFKVIIDKALDLNEFYGKEITYFTNSGSGYPTGNKLNIIDERIKDYTYAEKFDLISKRNQRIIEKEDEIKKYRDEQIDLFNWSLKQIFENKNLSKEDLKKEFDVFYIESDILENDKIYNDPLLMFLLLNGYIDEHYKEYISIFQKGGINEADQQFKINIISRISEPKSYNYSLTNIDDIINELPLNYFKNDRILNIDLVNHITLFKFNYKDKFQALLETIAIWDTKRIRNFFSSYIYNGKQTKQFIVELAKSWDKFWHTIEKDPHFIEEDKKQIIFILLNFADEETLLHINRNKELSSYIANDIGLLYNFNEEKDFNRIRNILSDKVLNVKFKTVLVLNDQYDKLFEIIYESNNYEITYNNLATIVQYKLGINFSFEKFNESNLTYICESLLKETIKYLELDNYNSYIKNIYSKLDYDQNETSTYILNVLNNQNVEEDLKLLFLRKQVNKLLNFNGIDKLIDCDLLVVEGKIETSWVNVYEYYWNYDNSFNETLNAFLNNKENYLTLASTVIKINEDNENSEGNNLQNEFILKLISNNNLEIESYIVFIEQCIPKEYKLADEFQYKLINKEKIEKLIQFDIIPLTVYNFKEIKSMFAGLQIKLLLRDWNSYLDFYEKHSTHIEIEDIILLLQDPDLKEGFKKYIIKNHISDDDLLNKELATEVANLLIENKSKLRDVDELLDFNRLKNILTNKLEYRSKVRLIILIGDKLTKEEVLVLKDLIQKPYKDIRSRSQIVFDDNDINWKFIKILQAKKIAGEAKSIEKNQIRVWFNSF